MPKTSLGKWSLALLIAMPLLILIGTSFANTLYESIPAGGTILADIVSRPALALTALAGMLAGVLAFITGLLAIIRQKERAILAYIVTVIGGILTVFIIAEFLSPT
jgi:hypothetical protein